MQAETSSPREDIGAIVARRFAELEDEAAAVAGPAPVRRRAEVHVESFSFFAKSLSVDLSIDGRWWPVLIDTENVDHETRWRRVAEEAFKAARVPR